MSIPTVEVINAQREVRLPRGLLRDLRMLGNRVLRREGVCFPVRVIIVDDQYLRDLKLEFLGKEGPTDVLAFPLGDEAEVYLSAQEAGRRGELGLELARLLVHALLHLAGYGHGPLMEERSRLYLEPWER